jgi:hypothetical protein
VLKQFFDYMFLVLIFSFEIDDLPGAGSQIVLFLGFHAFRGRLYYFIGYGLGIRPLFLDNPRSHFLAWQCVPYENLTAISKRTQPLAAMH